jgi:hypothetical protein
MAAAFQRHEAARGPTCVGRGPSLTDRGRKLELHHSVASRQRLLSSSQGGRENGEDAAAHAAGAHSRKIQVSSRAAVHEPRMVIAGQDIVVAVEHRQRAVGYGAHLRSPGVTHGIFSQPRRRGSDVYVRLDQMALPSTGTGRTLLAARTTLGLLTLLVPRPTGRAFLLDPADNPQLPVIARMWGIRNLSLAAGMYGAAGAGRSRWWRLQPVIDGLDFLVIVTEWRRDAVPKPAAGLMAGTALLATALGALSAGAESE